MTPSPDRTLAPGVQDMIDLCEKIISRYPNASVAELRRAEIDIISAINAREPAPSGSADDVGDIADVRIPTPDGSIAGRLYLPRHRRWHTTLVFWHGGGWVCGSIDTADTICRQLARRMAMPVLNAGYRLAPEFPFPHGLRDAAAAVRWAARSSAQWGGDGTIAVGGESAGANLACALTLKAREDGDLPLAAQLLLYPALSPELDTAAAVDNASGYELTTEAVRYFWRVYLDGTDGRNPLAAPLHASIFSDLPPAVIAAAELDPLRDDAISFADNLDRAGVPLSLHVFAGLIHGFARWPGYVPQADVALDQIAAAFTEMLPPTSLVKLEDHSD